MVSVPPEVRPISAVKMLIGDVFDAERNAIRHDLVTVCVQFDAPISPHWEQVCKPNCEQLIGRGIPEAIAKERMRDPKGSRCNNL